MYRYYLLFFAATPGATVLELVVAGVVRRRFGGGALEAEVVRRFATIGSTMSQTLPSRVLFASAALASVRADAWQRRGS